MDGFFSMSEMRALGGDRRGPDCARCGLCESGIVPEQRVYGEGKMDILVVTDNPSGTDITDASWFDYLDNVFRCSGVSLLDDCKIVHSVNCETPKHRPPTQTQIDSCRPMLWSLIEQMKPRLIILMGTLALNSFLADRWDKGVGSINRWRGFVIPDRKAKTMVAPIMHPRQVVQMEYDKAMDTVFRDDVLNAIDRRNSEFGREFLEEGAEEKDVALLFDEGAIIQALRTVVAKNGELVAFDYETNALKPHAVGMEVVVMSVATEHKAFVFQVTDALKPHIAEFLTCTTLRKCAANLKFEDGWSKVYFGVEVAGWEWDTMLAAHVLDNRPGVTGLKFQSYVELGVVDYSSHIEQYLKASASNRQNRVKDAPMKEIMLYCGLDSLLTVRLAQIQRGRLG